MQSFAIDMIDQATTVATDFTNTSIRRVSEHAEMRELESAAGLQKVTLGRGFKLLNRQGRAHGTAKMKLLGWRYYARLGEEDIVAAVKACQTARPVGVGKKGGKGKKGKGMGYKGAAQTPPAILGPAEEAALRQELDASPIYHCVVRGNDGALLPEVVSAGSVRSHLCDVVTNFFVTAHEELVNLIQDHFFDVVHGEVETGDDPKSAFEELMRDHGFKELLKVYYDTGDVKTERTLHLAGRIGGGACLLHTVIKENQTELLKVLLDGYSTAGRANATKPDDEPWLVLAEPFRAEGRYKLTALHRAVYDGRYECLELLVEHVTRHGLEPQLRAARNREDPRSAWRAAHDGVEGMTVLELAAKQGNLRCHDLLAPLFGVPVKGGVDAATREVNKHNEATARIETKITRTLPDGTCEQEANQIPVPDAAEGAAVPGIWARLAELIPDVLRTAAEANHGRPGGELELALCALRLPLPTGDDLRSFYAATFTAGYDVWVGSGLALRAVLFLACAPGQGADAARLTYTLIRGLQRCLAPVSDEAVDSDGLYKFAREVRVVPGFVRGGGGEGEGDPPPRLPLPAVASLLDDVAAGFFVVNVPMRRAVKRMVYSSTPTLRDRVGAADLAAFWAHCFAGNPVTALLRCVRLCAGGLYEYKTQHPKWREWLLGAAEAVRPIFFRVDVLLRDKPQDAADALCPAAWVFVAKVLTHWFRGWPAGADWAGFCCGMLEPFLLEGGGYPSGACEDFRAILDLGVWTLLRMHVALSSAHRRIRDAPDAALITHLPHWDVGEPFLACLRRLVPPHVRKELPETRAYFEKLETLY
eukprot:TRINITY_DN2867_c1_g1_i1.p1 TRINITY_DN2867_c1_g1~~TRINITY_DN2867_c1_g1_i1.p1  ORF type:complete len:817 (+),score=151.62 TRINITY_DN2867_c1_g1_i1:166-2616(+)